MCSSCKNDIINQYINCCCVCYNFYICPNCENKVNPHIHPNASKIEQVYKQILDLGFSQTEKILFFIISNNCNYNLAVSDLLE